MPPARPEPPSPLGALLPLCRLIAAVGPADWPSLRQAAESARALQAPRTMAEETLLQAVLFFGFPRVVTAFRELESAWPRGPEAPPREADDRPPAETHAAGRELFDGIYGSRAEDVRAMLGRFHPAFRDFVLESAYGRILTRPALDARGRELLAVAALAALDQEPQGIAHGRGALAFGADPAEVEAALGTGGLPPRDAARWLARILKDRTTGADATGADTADGSEPS